jgi:arylformamidase
VTAAMDAIPEGPPIDVTVPIRPGMPVYPGDPGVDISLARSIDRGDAANISRLDMGAHTGTHVDAPCHFISGARGASELSVERFLGRCLVVDATAATGPIDADVIRGLELPLGTERVLLRTRNSPLWERDEFATEFLRLDGSGAAAVIDGGVRVLGIDYLSIGDRAAHIALLERDVGVIEGLDLRAVEPGAYFLACLPLKIAGADGAPARALLWRLASSA